MPLPSIDPSQMFSKPVILITSVDKPSAPAHIQGQGGKRHRGIVCDWALQQISSACDKPTYPCGQVWRRRPLSCLVGMKKKKEHIGETHQPAGWHCCFQCEPSPGRFSELPVLLSHYQLFVQGQKVKRVDNTSRVIGGEKEREREGERKYAFYPRPLPLSLERRWQQRSGVVCVTPGEREREREREAPSTQSRFFGETA